MNLVYSLEEIDAAAAHILSYFKSQAVLAIHGSMGAGKTTLVHAICNKLEVKDTVSSPTFAIINQYQGAPGIIYHIDLYRLKDEEEAIRTGVEDCFYSGALCLVEWPEKAPGILPPDSMHILIEPVDELRRKLTVMS